VKGGKATEADHLAQVAKQLGKPLEEIFQSSGSSAPFPEAASHIWQVFIELHNGRSYGMNGPNPLSYDTIKAWCDLTGIRFAHWEVELIKALDLTLIKVISEEAND
jgi:hypothetical protein